ncbi:MAG: hypothetical protein ACRDQ1_18955, partial [Sciscionella sp.]
MGPVTIQLDDRALTPSVLARAVLAALTLAGDRGVSQDALLETVWGQREINAPSSTLAVTVHR